eukprot:69314_1
MAESQSSDNDSTNDNNTQSVCKETVSMSPNPWLFDLKFANIVDEKDRDVVFGYIGQQCQPLLPYEKSAYYNISKMINIFILSYYCTGQYLYNGDCKHWTIQELDGKYIPNSKLELDSQKTGRITLGKLEYLNLSLNLREPPRTIQYNGIATWFNKSKCIEYGTKVTMTKYNLLLKEAKTIVLREVYILRKLSHCSSVITLFHILPPVDFSNFSTLTIIYQRMDASLQQIFKTNQYFSELHVQYFMYKILLTIKYIHDSGIIHRDLQPANILVNAGRSLKIIGFGCAATLNEVKELLRTHIVHRWYRSPEVILLQHNCAKSLWSVDMWSIGCIFAELLQMQKNNCSAVWDRQPLFRGDSCFPLSPKRSRKTNKIYLSYRDQIRVIFEIIGTPTKSEINAINDENARSYVNEIPCQEAIDLSKHFPGTNSDGVELLKNLLKFDVKKRLNANGALKSSYFDRVRDVDLEDTYSSNINICELPKELRLFRNNEMTNKQFNKLLLEEMCDINAN